MNTFQLELMPHEITTRKLFNAAIAKERTNIRLMIAWVFVQHSAALLKKERVADLIIANHGVSDHLRDVLSHALGQLVREKVLRSRVIGRVTHWEVNY